MSARWIAVAGLALALAGCSRQGPTPVEDETFNEPEIVEPAPPPPPVEVPPPVAGNDVSENLAEPVEEPVDESAQTLEDADAVGMTTRALPNAEDEDTPATNDGTDESGKTGEE